MSLKGTTTSVHSGPGSNGNERVHYTAQISRARALQSDVLYCHTQDISLEQGVGDLTPPSSDTGSIF